MLSEKKIVNKIVEVYLIEFMGSRKDTGRVQVLLLLSTGGSELHTCGSRGWHGLSQLREKNNPILKREQALT